MTPAIAWTCLADVCGILAGIQLPTSAVLCPALPSACADHGI